MKLFCLAAFCFLSMTASRAQQTVRDFFTAYEQAVDPLHKLDTFTDLDLRVKGKIMLRADGRSFENILRCHHSVNGDDQCIEESTHRSIPMEVAPLPGEAKGKNMIRYALNLVLFEGRLEAFTFHAQTDTSIVLKEKVSETNYRLLSFNRNTKLLQEVKSIKWQDGKERINTKRYSDFKRIEDIHLATRCDESNEHVSNIIQFLDVVLRRREGK
jgi:hypothetical protein